MSGSHRANPNTIQIVRATVLRKAADIRRPRSFEYRVIYILINYLKGDTVKFPIVKTLPRAS